MAKGDFKRIPISAMDENDSKGAYIFCPDRRKPHWQVNPKNCEKCDFFGGIVEDKDILCSYVQEKLPTTTIDFICHCCKKHFSVEVFKEDLDKYNNGELIQKCFPYLTPSQRELFISGICEKCFDAL